jgi:light-regulated signal transduction histidine kinase (bacteriophytochrome)
MNTPQDDFYNDLISIVAHDLKTPISAVKGFIELVQQAGPLNDQQQHFSDRALLSLQRMERLIADLLEYARLNSTNRFDLAPCDIGALVNEAVELLEEVPLGVTLPSRPLRRLSTGRLWGCQAAVTGHHNLIGNAVNGTIATGQVFVQRDRRAGGASRRRARHRRGIRRKSWSNLRAVLSVEAQPGYEGRQRTRSGNCPDDCEKHGGRIWVESVQGEGAPSALPCRARKSPGRQPLIARMISTRLAARPSTQWTTTCRKPRSPRKQTPRATRSDL